jgi:hypothetical protein
MVSSQEREGYPKVIAGGDPNEAAILAFCGNQRCRFAASMELII